MTLLQSIIAIIIVCAFCYLILYFIAHIIDLEEKVVEMEIRLKQLEGIKPGRGHETKEEETA